MKKILPVLTFCLLLCFTFLFFAVRSSLAEDVSAVGVATYIPINETVENGDIVSATDKGYFLSTTEYDPQVIGVVATTPAIALKTSSEQKGIPVVNIGSTVVKVNGTNGNIKRGDFITTSRIKGTGMKATRNGFIVGQALEDRSFANQNDTGLIAISLNVHFLQVPGSAVNASIMQIFSITQLAAYEEPLKVFKYVVSAIVLFVSFGAAFFIFSKAINTGIQALGRNPLAGRMIQLSIIFNVVLVIIIIMAGIGIVWIFLRL